MRILKNRTKLGIPHYLVLIWNRTKPGTALIETVLNGDPQYKDLKCFALELSVFKTKCLRSLFKILSKDIRLEKKIKLEIEKGCYIFSIWFQSPIWLKREQGVVWWCFMIRMKRKLLKGRFVGRPQGCQARRFGAEICGGLMCVKVLVYAAGDALLFTFGWDH